MTDDDYQAQRADMTPERIWAARVTAMRYERTRLEEMPEWDFTRSNPSPPRGDPVRIAYLELHPSDLFDLVMHPQARIFMRQDTSGDWVVFDIPIRESEKHVTPNATLTNGWQEVI